MARAKPAPEPWKNRIVGYASLAPGELVQHPQNWRAHPDHQRAALEGSLTEVGWVAEVLVNQRSGTMIDGHLRVASALAHREPTVPVRYVDLSDDEERLILATLDPITAQATALNDRLAALLETLHPADAALQQLLRDLAPPVQKHLNPDDADLTPPEEPITQPGDLWVLGEHRLLCGDALLVEDHERVLDGIQPDCVLTDPPYGVGVEYDGIDDGWPLISRIIAETVPLLRRWPVVAITTGARWLWRYPEPTWLLAWVHTAPTGLGPWGFTGLNPALVYGDDPYLKHGLGSRNDTVVMHVDRDGVEGHPRPKPLKVWEWFVERCTTESGQVVFDPFMGSGTTLVACETLSRVSCGIELSPAYCDVIVHRWETVTGQKAERA